jgi:hypothetical protein
VKSTVNLLEAFEANRLDLANQVQAAADAIAATENMSLHTTVQFLDNGAVKLTQITGVASQGIVTLTRSQALELMDRIAAGVLSAQGAVS